MRAAPLRGSFVAYPLALLAACFAMGIVMARFVAVPLAVCLTLDVIFSAFAVWRFARGWQGHGTLLICIAFFWAGATLAMVEKSEVTEDRVQRLYDDGIIASGDPVEVTGVLERQPEPAPEGFYLRLRVEKLRFKAVEREARGVVWLFAPVRDGATRAEYEMLELRYGARVRVMAALKRAEEFRNPGVSSLTEYLERQGYDATATIKSPLLVERLDDESVFLPLMWLYEWRQRLLAEIDRRFSVETAGVLKAALLGNRYQLSRGAAERFREGGTFHILIISGLHISFIGGIVLLIARRVTRRRAWQFALSVTFLWAYTLAVGAESSVVRAALMFTLVALAPLAQRRASSLNALGGALLILLVWRPADLFDPSLQLTFLSVLMIVAVAWPLLQKLKEVGVWRPTRETPYPPACPGWWRGLGEALFWSEKEWRIEMARSVWTCRLFKTAWAARLERWRAQCVLRYAVGAAAVSAIVQAGLLPLLVIYFHRLSLASLVLNIGVGVLMAVLSLVSLAALLAAQLSATVAAPLIRLAEITNWLMIHSADPFIDARLASIRLPEYTSWAAAIYVLYYAPVVFLAVALARWNPLRLEASPMNESAKTIVRLAPQLAGLSLVIVMVMIVAHPLSAGRPDGRLRIDFLDVGQGDAALLTMPDGTTLLIDGGGRPNRSASAYRDQEGNEQQFERDTRSIGEAVVSEYLWWRGLDHVDYVLASHADADHIDGLNDVMSNFRARAAVVVRQPAGDAEYARFAATAQRQGIPVYQLGRGDLFRIGGVEVEVRWPMPAPDGRAPSRNDDSMVLRLRFGEKTFLFTGDIEKSAEAALASTHEDLRCDVLKVAHHGSKTSSIESFVAATHPSFAVIPVGLSSIYGHPHREVVERWRASGAQILTTGRSGTITISTDGHDLKVETFVKQ
jgi:competence protein ComEC